MNFPGGSRIKTTARKSTASGIPRPPIKAHETETPARANPSQPISNADDLVGVDSPPSPIMATKDFVKDPSAWGKIIKHRGHAKALEYLVKPKDAMLKRCWVSLSVVEAKRKDLLSEYRLEIRKSALERHKRQFDRRSDTSADLSESDKSMPLSSQSPIQNQDVHSVQKKIRVDNPAQARPALAKASSREKFATNDSVKNKPGPEMANLPEEVHAGNSGASRPVAASESLPADITVAEPDQVTITLAVPRAAAPPLEVRQAPEVKEILCQTDLLMSNVIEKKTSREFSTQTDLTYFIWDICMK